MFTTKLFWFTNDDQPIDREHTTEAGARGWAEKRSSEVQGRVEIRPKGSKDKPIAIYKGGELVSAS